DAPARTRQMESPAETSRRDNGAGDNLSHLSVAEESPVAVTNSEKTAGQVSSSLCQTVMQQQMAASILLQPRVRLQNVAPRDFHERTITEQIEIMSEQLALQEKVMIRQLDLLH